MANAGWTLESCAHVTRGGGAPTPGHDADNQSRASRVAAEQTRLIEWAEENRKLASSSRLPPFFAEGGEHRVYFRKNGYRYVKVTRTDRHRGYGIVLGSFVHGATPSEYLDRLALQNCLFNDDIRLERIVSKEKPNSIKEALFPFVTSVEVDSGGETSTTGEGTYPLRLFRPFSFLSAI
jgi:hypothetical protein